MNLDPLIYKKKSFSKTLFKNLAKMKWEKKFFNGKSAVVKTKTLFQIMPFRQCRYPAIPLKNLTSIDRRRLPCRAVDIPTL